MKQNIFKIALICLGMTAMTTSAMAQTAAAAGTTDAPKEEEFKPSGKLWGYTFGDYSYKVHSDSTGAKRTSPGNQYLGVPKDFSSFQLRRIYLGYDYNIAKGVSTQLLLAHESDATLAGDGNRTFYIKLANIRWTFAKNTDLVVGSQETPGFPMLEERIWGYRSVEKTITDFRKVISSTDLGASIQGKLNDKGDYGYNLLFSNSTGAAPLISNPSANNTYGYKKLSADIYAKMMDQKVVVDVYGDYQLNQRITTSGPIMPMEKSKATVKIFLAYTSDMITIGATAFGQVWEHAATDTIKIIGTPNTHQTVNSMVMGYSFFVRGQIIKDKLNFFARYDSYNPDTKYKASNETTTYKYSTTPSNYSLGAPVMEQFLTAGIDWMPAHNVHFMPNIWFDSYSNPAYKASHLNKMDNDIEARLTFYYIFGKDNANIPGKL